MGTAEFSFALNCSTIAAAFAAGYVDFGNIVSFTNKLDTQKVEHKGSWRGVRTLDATYVTESKHQYTLKCDEWNKQTLQILFGGDIGTPFTQAAWTAQAFDTFGFTAVPAVIGRWYDLLKAGVHYRNTSTVTIAAKVEGTDFVVDIKLGRVKFLTSQAADLIPLVTNLAITATDTTSFFSITPLTNVRRTGMGRLVVFDQNSPNIVIDHLDFLCEIVLDSASEVGGTAFSDFSMTITAQPPAKPVFARLGNA